MLQSIKRRLGHSKATKKQLLFYLYYVRADSSYRRQNEREIKRLTGGDITKLEPDDPCLTFDRLYRFSKMVQLYSYLSSCWMVYSLAKYVYPPLLQTPLSWLNLKLPPRCYLFGRLYLHESFNEEIAIMHSILHLGYRAITKIAQIDYPSGCYEFMMQDEKDLARFYESLCNPKWSDEPVADRFDEYYSKLMCRRLEPLGRRAEEINGSAWPASRTADLKRRQQLSCNRQKRKEPPDGWQQARPRYKLRPNRSWESLHELRGRLANCTLYLASFLSTIGLAVSLNISYNIFRDKSYLQTYVNCNSHLADLEAKGELGQWSFTLDKHRCLALIGDIVENVILWLDAALSALSAYILVYICNHDMLMYGQSITLVLAQWIEDLDERVTWETMELSFCAVGTPLDLDSPTRTDCNRWSSLAAAESKQLCISLPQAKPSGQREDRSLASSARVASEKCCPLTCDDAIVHELTHELHDFFDQVRRNDALVSQILTTTLIAWLTGAAGYYYSFEKTPANKAVPPFYVHGTSVLGYFCLSVVSHYLLTLNRKCKQLYSQSFSLMARTRSGRRHELLKMLRYFVDRRGATYTLFHSVPYTTTKFLAINGWTFTVLAILFSNSREHLARWRRWAIDTMEVCEPNDSSFCPN